jgi:hypothetical protein
MHGSSIRSTRDPERHRIDEPLYGFSREGDQRDNQRETVDEVCATAAAPRGWPSAPKRAMVIELDGDKARLEQHLRMNGGSIKAIAARIHSPVFRQVALSTL